MTPVEAAQVVLAGEHAAVHLLGVVGGRVSTSADPALADAVRAAYTRHRGRRDQLASMLRDQGADPVVAAVAYELPGPATTPDELTAVALLVEERCSALYADLVGATSGRWRRWALTALEEAAVGSLSFGASAAAFPGAAEL